MALNALQVINLPGARGPFDGDRMRGALSLAKAAEDTQINIIINLATRGRIIGAWFCRIWMGGRF